MYKGLRGFCIVILVMLLIVMKGGSAWVRMAFSKPVDIYGEEITDAEQIKKGLAIETELPLLMECFGSKTQTQKSNDTTYVSDADYYYIMPVPVGEDTYFVALEARAKQENYEMLEALSRSTMDWFYMESEEINAAPVPITGGLVSLEEEIYKYMKEWFVEVGWFENNEDVGKYVLPLCLKQTDFGSQKVVFFVEIVIAVALVAAIILLTVKDKKSRKTLDAEKV